MVLPNQQAFLARSYHWFPLTKTSTLAMPAHYSIILSKRSPGEDDASDDEFGGWYYSEVRHPPLVDNLHSDDLGIV